MENQPRQPDGFDRAIAALNEWDRACRELHEKHMAELAESRARWAELQREWE